MPRLSPAAIAALNAAQAKSAAPPEPIMVTVQGPRGETGIQGVQGQTGPRGPVGETGVPGTLGLIGDPGPVGPKGAVGPVGPKGPVGATGPAGRDGIGPDEKVKLDAADPEAGYLEAKLQPGLNVKFRRSKNGKALVIDATGGGAAISTGGGGGRGPTGPQGPAGPEGPPGPQGEPGEGTGSDDQTAAEVPVDPEVFGEDNVQDALVNAEILFGDLNGTVNDHIADPEDSHAASAITFNPAGPITATNTQEAVEQAAALATSSTIMSNSAPTELDLAPAGAMWVHIDDALVYINYGTDTEPIWLPPQRDDIEQILTNGNVAGGLDILDLGRLGSETGHWETNRLTLGVEGTSITPPTIFSIEDPVASPFTSSRLIRFLDGAALWAGTDDPSAVVPASAEFTLEPDGVPVPDDFLSLNVQTPTGWYRTTSHIPLDPGASAADIQTALENLANVGPGNVIVTGGPFPAEVTIAFTGDLADTQVAMGIEDANMSLIFVETVIGACPIISGVGGLYMRDNAGTAELWQKTDAADTDWTQMGTGGGLPDLSGLSLIADPTLATPQSNAEKLNDLMTALGVT